MVFSGFHLESSSHGLKEEEEDEEKMTSPLSFNSIKNSYTKMGSET